jgi:hypothetical protein
LVSQLPLGPAAVGARNLFLDAALTMLCALIVHVDDPFRFAA